MQKLLKLTIVTLFIWMTGCASDAIGVKDENMSTRTVDSVNYQVLKSGQVPHDKNLYDEKEKRLEFFHSDRPEEVAAFAALYGALTGEEAPAFEGSVIVATAGRKSTGGYSFELKSVTEKEGTAEVKLLLKTPSEGALVTTALTNPYIVILLPERFTAIKVIEE